MTEDDGIRKTLRQWVNESDIGQPDLTSIHGAARARKIRRTSLPVIGVAAGVLVLLGPLAWLARDLGGQPLQADGEIPVTSQTVPSPPPRPSAEPESIPGIPFALNLRPGLDGNDQVGGVGDTVEGLTLVDIDIVTRICDPDVMCPDYALITVRNDSNEMFSRSFGILVYQGPFVDQTQFTGSELDPGEEASFRLDFWPMINKNAFHQHGPYTWQFLVAQD